MEPGFVAFVCAHMTGIAVHIVFVVLVKRSHKRNFWKTGIL